MLEGTQNPAVSVVNKFAALPKVAKLPPGREWTYFLRADCPGRLVKIGNSVNLKWRLSGLQTQCPVQLSLVGLANTPAGTELLLHEALAKARAHGEWFYPTADVDRIRRAMPKGGSIEGPQIVKLLAPLGISEDRVHQVFVWALKTEKHAHNEDEDTASLRKAADEVYLAKRFGRWDHMKREHNEPDY